MLLHSLVSLPLHFYKNQTLTNLMLEYLEEEKYKYAIEIRQKYGMRIEKLKQNNLEKELQHGYLRLAKAYYSQSNYEECIDLLENFAYVMIDGNQKFGLFNAEREHSSKSRLLIYESNILILKAYYMRSKSKDSQKLNLAEKFNKIKDRLSKFIQSLKFSYFFVKKVTQITQSFEKRAKNYEKYMQLSVKEKQNFKLNEKQLQSQFEKYFGSNKKKLKKQFTHEDDENISYLISQEWLKSWLMWRKHQSSINYPGPVNQFQIEDTLYNIKNIQDDQFLGVFLFKQSKIVYVDKEIWSHFDKYYGGRKVIRKWINGSCFCCSQKLELFLKRSTRKYENMEIYQQISESQPKNSSNKKTEHPPQELNQKLKKQNANQSDNVNNKPKNKPKNKNSIELSSQQANRLFSSKDVKLPLVNVFSKPKQTQSLAKQNIIKRDPRFFLPHPPPQIYLQVKDVEPPNSANNMVSDDLQSIPVMDEEYPVSYEEKAAPEKQMFEQSQKITYEVTIPEGLKSISEGLVGLNNIGSTCYMNSAIQCLRHTPELTDYFLSKQRSFEQDINEENDMGTGGKVARAYHDLVQELFSEKKSIAPHRFKKEIGLSNSQFADFTQQDSQELLSTLLDSLQEDLCRSKPKQNYKFENKGLSEQKLSLQYQTMFRKKFDSIIADIFFGQYKIQSQCLKCTNIEKNFDSFLVLHVPLYPIEGFGVKMQNEKSKNKIKTLDQCLKIIPIPQILSGMNSIECGLCESQQQTKKTIEVFKSSKVLIVALKRFTDSSKLNDFVDFPLQLDMAPYLSSSEARKSPKVYYLYAIINHKGTLEGGHYWAYCKNFKNGKWYSYDDSRVGPIDEKSLVASHAYVLFYRLMTERREKVKVAKRI